MIHYHGTPFSGDTLNLIRSMTARHTMISFARPDQVKICAEICQSFTFDNGAFTAWKTGKTYDMEKFAGWVDEWHLHPGFDWYVIPDAIDADERENIKMIARWRSLVAGSRLFGLGVPVWHMHESLASLDYLCHAYPRVALGSSGAYATVGDKAWWGRMAKAMEVATYTDGSPRCKLHGLRMLNPTVFSQLPLSSADSTMVGRNLGVCSAWKGTYLPVHKETRARILAERIEVRASASRWAGASEGVEMNEELLG